MTDAYYQITRQAGAVRLSGDFDINARDELRAVLAQAVEEDSTGALVVDFDGVVFLDSEALSALIDGFVAARAAGVKLSIVNAHGLVHRVLEVSGVLEMFSGPTG
ncbi:STAS domain-containing protein [Actinoplanes sp. NPDC049548]|uniref:STAS domain-containing protein n=1 Tax=Actinoplanes sp. NPDC049548 TaxID=3155152 RepID=UPI00342B7F6B